MTKCATLGVYVSVTETVDIKSGCEYEHVVQEALQAQPPRGSPRAPGGTGQASQCVLTTSEGA